MVQLISNKVKQTWVIQAIRSGAQWLATFVIGLGVVQEAVEVVGADGTEFETAVRGVFGVLLFVVYILAVRLLEKVDSRFGWLNGWKTELRYEAERADA